jgi:hypothetical protein
MNVSADSNPGDPAEISPRASEPAPPGEKRWTRSRWLTLVLLIFAAHVGLLFAFGARKPAVPRAVANVPRLVLAAEADELIALSDPTLFALPHPMDLAVLRAHASDLTQTSFRWTEEPPGWLNLPVAALGVDFGKFMKTNRYTGLELQLKPPLKLTTPVSPLEPIFPEVSTLRVEGGLAQRQLLTTMELPSWPCADVLAPSVVQTVVDAAGNVVSVVLLPPGSGWDDADQHALKLARAARFAPGPRLTIGRLVFHWHTVPLPGTNAPVSPDAPRS